MASASLTINGLSIAVEGQSVSIDRSRIVIDGVHVASIIDGTVLDEKRGAIIEQKGKKSFTVRMIGGPDPGGSHIEYEDSVRGIEDPVKDLPSQERAGFWKRLFGVFHV